MSKTISKFRFKQFSVSHHRSSMKVGVDGVLIGCWTDIGNARRILDVGTGCGVVALILAQRSNDAMIDAIDIDIPSIEEASENISSSPWPDRIRTVLCSYADAGVLQVDDHSRYDLIVSNPPYFDSGVSNIVTAREKARHQAELSPLALIKGAVDLLNPGGSVALVLPCDISDDIEKDSQIYGFQLKRKCLVRGHEHAPFKRVLLQWTLGDDHDESVEVYPEHLTLEIAPGIPTGDYRTLCGDFYLKF